MKLTPVIAALRARCPYFENRVAGAAQFKNLPDIVHHIIRSKLTALITPVTQYDNHGETLFQLLPVVGLAFV
ncbi:hypothetical protein QU845_25120, partial [Escherichia coli]|nr:hypothetical protein [Escherichia coli]